MRFLTTLALCGLSTAHFVINYPKSIGFEDRNEDQAPCGGFQPDLSKDLFDFHVGGEALSVKLFHQQSTWLFRVTTDPEAKKDWEEIYPVVMQSGLGDFCIPQVTVPEKYIGKKGIVSVVSHAVDGMLYQCITANFVKGSQKAPSACKNASIQAYFTEDKELSALTGDQTSDSSNGGAATTSGSAAAPTKSSGAAGAGLRWQASGSVMGTMTGGMLMALLGALMMI